MDNINKEFERFNKHFIRFQKKRIVLYGAGRNTRNILPLLKDYRIIGILDGDDKKTGKSIGEIPIITLKEAENTAEMIIINTAEIYWRLIYDRIQQVSVPVFLKNGIRAEDYFKEYSEKSLFAICKDEIQLRIASIINNYLKEIAFSGEFRTWKDWGYCVWGPVVWVYLLWLCENAKRDDVNKLLFLSRDGFLLEKAYIIMTDYQCEKENPVSKYVMSSRRLTYYAAISDDNSFEEYAFYFYNGYYSDYLNVRFGIVLDQTDDNYNLYIRLPENKKIVRKLMEKYLPAIKSDILEQKKIYRQYLKEICDSDHIGLVDTGYTGRIGACIGKLLHQPGVKSYMFYGDKSITNPYGENIKTCFQMHNDYLAEYSALRRQSFLVETVFCAPEGSAIRIGSEGFEYGKPQSFEINRLVFHGIEQFIKDMSNDSTHNEEYLKQSLFIDRLFGFLTTHTKLEDNLQRMLQWEDLWSGNQAMNSGRL